MSNTTDKKISLWISGNQIRSKGFEDLILIKPQFPKLTYIGVPGVEHNPYVFVVKIGPNYTQYTLVHHRITTSDGNPNALLKIAIGIPAKYRLAGGVSPYQVLMDIRNLFVTKQMRPTLGVEGGYTYKADAMDTQAFSEQLEQYVLESAAMPHREMKGSEQALVVLEEPEIAELMKDVQYKEFTKYGEVVLAPLANESVYPGRVLRSLVIPRRPDFTLLVNGKPVEWSVSDIFNQITTLKTNKDTSCYENVQISFCLKDLMAGNIPKGVTFDPTEEVVSCDLMAIEKKRSFNVILTGCSHTDRCLKQVRFVLDDGSAVSVDADGKLVLRGLQMKSKVKVEYGGTDYTISEYSQNGAILTIVLKPNPNAKSQGRNLAAYGPGMVVLSLGITGLEEEKLVCRVNVTETKGQMMYEQLVSFARTEGENEGKSSAALHAVVPLSPAWQGKNVDIHLKSLHYQSAQSVQSGRLEVGENELTVNNLEPLKFYHAWLEHWKILVLACCLPLCFVMGYVVKSLLTPEPAKEPVEVAVPETKSMEENADFVPQEALMDWKRCQQILNDSTHNILFDEIFKLYGWLQMPENDSLMRTCPGMREKAEAYYQISRAIRSNSYAKLKAMIEKPKYKELLNEKDLWDLQRISFGYRDSLGTVHQYTEDELRSVKEAFTKGKYASFGDLRQLGGTK